MKNVPSPPTGLSDNGHFLRSAFNRQLLPAILSVGGVMAGTMANSIIAGNLLGHEALAVMSIASPIYSVFATIGSLTGVGGAAMASWSVGRNDARGCSRAFTMACVLTLGGAFFVTLLGHLLLDPFLTLLGAEGALHALAKPYAAFFLLGGVGVSGIYIPYFFLKLEGRVRLSVLLFVFLAGLNVGLDLLFVLCTPMGIAGIAAGTAISNVLAAVIGTVLLLRGGSLHICSLRGHWHSALRLITAGSPAALNNLCNVVRSIALNRLIFSLAAEAGLSAFSIVTTASSLALMAINGLSQTTVPFAGVFSAERDNASLRQLEKRAALEGTAIIVPFALCLALLAKPFCALFGVREAALLSQCAEAVAIFAFSLPPAMLSTVLVNYYQAAGFTALANFLTACRSLVLLLLPAWALAPALGVRSVWLAFTLCELLSLAALAAALLFYRRRHPRRRGILLLDRHYEDNGQYISFSVKSTPEDIVETSQRISEFCNRNALDAQRAMLISLSLEEILMSIKDHCFAGREDADMSIRILIAGEMGEDSIVILRIRCGGESFNPIAYYESHRAALLQGADGDGELLMDDSLGIAMIVQAARSVDYQSTFGMNNLTILL